jgi:beta-glucosidase
MNEGLWASEKTTKAFVNYVEVMMKHLPKEVTLFNTINEPGIFSMFGYLSKMKFPPGIQNENIFIKASDNIISAHKQSMKIIKKYNPMAKVGMTHALHEWDDNDTSTQKEYIKFHMEDKFLNASDEDDFIALQTYSIRRTSPNIFYRALSWIQIKIPILRIYIYPRFRDIFAGRHEYEPDGIRTTKMGYEYRPQAILYNLHRIHSIFPNKEIFITENGIATDDDNERVEFVTDVLNDVHDYISKHGKVMGYLYWSVLDNFEWDLGYKMNFGLVEVNKEDYSRKPHKSAYWFGQISNTNNLSN